MMFDDVMMFDIVDSLSVPWALSHRCVRQRIAKHLNLFQPKQGQRIQQHMQVSFRPSE